jgi:alpha-methylacyl-CoA racemase
MSGGPLSGVLVLEIVGLGPGPFCGMMLSDMGADVIRVDRVDTSKMLSLHDPKFDVLARGRRSVALDLTKSEGIEVLLAMVEQADVLFEGMRPGVAERLGFGPEACEQRNPRLVFGRMTGWGQDGPLAKTAGHDINYLALSGMLHAVGRAGEPPSPPLNLIADFGGGGMMMTVGILAALLEVKTSGRGQVVDAAMFEGASLLGAMTHGLDAAGVWTTERESNLLDGGAPFYDTYRTLDERFVAVGALEPQFFAELVAGLGLGPLSDTQWVRSEWGVMRSQFTEVFESRTRDEWADVFRGVDACVSPVLTYEEAALHEHAVARDSFLYPDGFRQPAPAPRFSRTPAQPPEAPSIPGDDTLDVLLEFGFSQEKISALSNAHVCR